MSKLAIVLCALFCATAINAGVVPDTSDATQTVIDIANELGEDIVLQAAAELNIAKETMDIILSNAIIKIKEYIMKNPDVKYIVDQFNEVSNDMTVHLERALSIILKCAQTEISSRLQSKVKDIIGNIELQPEGDSAEKNTSEEPEEDIKEVPLAPIEDLTGGDSSSSESDILDDLSAESELEVQPKPEEPTSKKPVSEIPDLEQVVYM